MLKNYLTIAFRNLRKHPGFTLLNAAGLAVGIACCLLMALYVQYERSYDRFHERADDLYRVAWINADHPQTRTPHPMAQALAADFPEVESAVSLTPLQGPNLTRPTFAVRYEDRQFDEHEILAVDTTFFEVFSFPVVQGDAGAALRTPFQILLTASMAEKYFGDADPIGRELIINGERRLTVGAVLADVPANSHIRFDFLLSYTTLKALDPDDPFFSWEDFGHYNYLRLAPGADADALERRIRTWITSYLELPLDAREAFNAGRIGFRLQPVPDIHLHSNLHWELTPGGNIAYVYLFSAAALFILLIACINFMNLTTARSADRAREVGVRKALGAQRRQLAGQFLAESIGLSVIAGLLAIGLVELATPFFRALTGVPLRLWDLPWTTVLAAVVGVLLLTGLLAGAYPALVLSGFNPVRVLKGERDFSARGTLRRVLVVGQFTLAIALIAGTLALYQQLRYIQQHNLGFDQEQVVVLNVGEDAIADRLDAFEDAVRQHPGVVSVGAATNVPGGRFNNNRVQLRQDQPAVAMAEMYVDFDLLETLGLELAAGRAFDRARPADSLVFILNETAAAMLASQDLAPDDLVGQEITWFAEPYQGGTLRGRVIGIVKDFHFQSLHQSIGPMILRIAPGDLNYLLVRVRPAQARETLAHLESVWADFGAQRSFTYSFLDQDFDALYRAEQRAGVLFIVFAGLGLLVACLGLLGLASFTTRQRTKEIGVRKVLGASVPGLVWLLTTEFVRLVVLAFVVAAPLAYLGIQRWLDDFAYRIDLSWLIFLAAGLTALVVAILTVSYQAIRAARANPVKSLRYE